MPYRLAQFKRITRGYMSFNDYVIYMKNLVEINDRLKLAAILAFLNS